MILVKRQKQKGASKKLLFFNFHQFGHFEASYVKIEFFLKILENDRVSIWSMLCSHSHHLFSIPGNAIRPFYLMSLVSFQIIFMVFGPIDSWKHKLSRLAFFCAGKNAKPSQATLSPLTPY